MPFSIYITSTTSLIISHNIGENHLTRPVFQAQGLDHLQAAVDLNPTSSSLMYHIAYARAEARQTDLAVTTVREALELDTNNLEAWHLLALLLTAQKDWQGAMKAIKAGIETWEEMEECLAKQEIAVSAKGNSLGLVDSSIQQKDFAITSAPDSRNPSKSDTNPGEETVFDNIQLILPTGLLPIDPIFSIKSIPSLSHARRLAKVIQLRMTQAVIVEKVEGPGSAMWRQQETFAYFSARSGYMRPGGATAGEASRANSVRDLGGSFVAVPAAPGMSMGETQICMSSHDHLFPDLDSLTNAFVL